MTFLKQLERYKKLDDLIKNENTGSPIELANRLEISRSHLYRLIGILKDYGAEINYCRRNNTFRYNDYFNLNKQIYK